MTYVKQIWSNGVAGGTPISAARLSHIEDGIAAAVLASDATTVTELQTAITAATAAGGGDIRVSVPIALGTTQLTFPNNVNLLCVGRGELTSTTTGIALTFDSQHHCHSVIKLRRLSPQWDTGVDTTSIGIRLRNCSWSTYDVRHLTFFETGLELRGDAAAVDAGTAYCTIYPQRIVSNKRNIRFSGVTSGAGIGFANGNTFIGGAVRTDGGFSSYVGTRGIDMANAGNGNTFIGVNLEAGLVEKTVHIAETDNVFLGCRLEAVTKFHFMSTATGNQVIGGYGNFGPGTSFFQDDSPSEQNMIIGSRGMSLAGDSSSGTPLNGGLANYEARPLVSNADAGFRCKRIDGTKSWEVLSDGTNQAYVAGESFPRWKNLLTSGPGGYAGRAEGRGNAEPDATFGRTGGNSPGWIANCPIIRKTVSSTWASGGLALVVSSGEIYRVTMTGAVGGFSLSGAVEIGHTITLSFIQDATGGRTPSWPSNIKLAGGVVPAPADASKETSITIMWDGTNWKELSRAVNVG